MTTFITLIMLLVAVPTYAQSIALTWVDNSVTANKATAFVVCRTVGTNPTFNEVGRPSATTYTDSTVATGSTYTYKVRATNTKGEMSPFSNTWTGTIPTPVAPLAAPSNLTGTIGTTTPTTTETPTGTQE